MNKATLVTAAITGLLLASIAQAEGAATTDKAAATGECHGTNSCKGKGECGGAGHACAGKNSCKGKGWVKKTEAECKAMKGTFKAEKA